MMHLFGKRETPVQHATNERSKAQEKLTRLKEQEATAAEELVELKVQAQHAAEGFGTGLDDLSHEIAAAEAKVSALANAVNVVQAECDRCAAELAAQRDREQRQKSIVETEQLHEDMREPLEQLLASVTKLEPLAKRGATFAIGMQEIAGWFEKLAAEYPQVVEIINKTLTAYAAGIRAGTLRATLPQAEEVKPATVATKPPAQVGIISKYSLKWTDANGQTRTIAPYWDAGVPELIAARAIAHGVAIASEHPDAKALRVRRTGFGADLNQLCDLDVEHPEPPSKQPAVWIGPSHIRRYEPEPIKTSAPLSSWTGQQTWIRPSGNTPTNGGETF